MIGIYFGTPEIGNNRNMFWYPRFWEDNVTLFYKGNKMYYSSLFNEDNEPDCIILFLENNCDCKGPYGEGQEVSLYITVNPLSHDLESRFV